MCVTCVCVVCFRSAEEIPEEFINRLNQNIRSRVRKPDSKDLIVFNDEEDEMSGDESMLQSEPSISTTEPHPVNYDDSGIPGGEEHRNAKNLEALSVAEPLLVEESRIVVIPEALVEGGGEGEGGGGGRARAESSVGGEEWVGECGGCESDEGVRKMRV